MTGSQASELHEPWGPLLQYNGCPAFSKSRHSFSLSWDTHVWGSMRKTGATVFNEKGGNAYEKQKWVRWPLQCPLNSGKNNSCLVLIQSNLSEFMFLNSSPWLPYRQKKHMVFAKPGSPLPNHRPDLKARACVPSGSHPITHLGVLGPGIGSLKVESSWEGRTFKGSQKMVAFYS